MAQEANVPETIRTLLAAGPIPDEGEQAYPGAHLGVFVVDASSGDVLIDVRGSDAFTPASNQKLLVTAAALYMLGEDFRFETQVLAPPLEDGVLEHLTLRGEGDPSLSSVGRTNSLEALATQLYEAGVREVGDVRIDDFAFDWPRWGSGWMWDDPAYPIGAVFLEGAGTPYAEMAVGAGANPELVTDPVVYPLAVGRLFQNELARVGIEVTGGLGRAPAEDGDAVLVRTRSRPLATLISETNKPSSNTYAEQLYARLGLGEDGVSTPDSSYEALGAFLAQAGVDIEALRVRDGSGLSRYNLVAPRHFVALLRHIYLNPITTGAAVSPREGFGDASNLFIASLPVLGAAGDEGGTLSERLVGEGLTVSAKTGSMTGIASLSGYLRAASGRDLVFSMMMDNYPGSISDLQRLQDALLLELHTLY